MGYRIAAIVLMLAFYAFYIRKLLLQRRQSIRTNQMGTGNKPAKVLWIERIMGIATVLTIVVECLSILLVKEPSAEKHPALGIIGILLGAAAVIVFAAATITMKDSWRVGIPEEKTAIITRGIYAVSRNPAFVGFDLLYLAIVLLFFNLPLLLISVWAMVMLHLQILQEEAWLMVTFPEEYSAYYRRVCRYFGRRRCSKHTS